MNDTNIFIYILECENGKYYIGRTKNPNFRLEDHFRGGGSVWTHKYKPISFHLISNRDVFDEDKYVKMYMEKYGIDNVRGGAYSQVELSEDVKKIIESEIRNAQDQCHTCGGKDHFMNECPQKHERKNQARIFCFKCGFEDHKSPDCVAQKDINGYKINRDFETHCYRCGRNNHYFSNCFSKVDVNGQYII